MSASRAVAAQKAVNATLGGVTATRLAARFKRALGLTGREAAARVAALKKWYVLKIAAGDFDATRLSPPARVDEAWHLHVLETKHYSRDVWTRRAPRSGWRRRRFRTRDAHRGDEEGAPTRLRRPLRQDDLGVADTRARAQTRGAEIVEGLAEARDGRRGRRFAQHPRALPDKRGNVFQGQDDDETQQSIDAYAERTGIAASSFRFLFDGRRLYGYETPADIGLAEGGQIDTSTMLDQRGCSPLDHHPRT